MATKHSSAGPSYLRVLVALALIVGILYLAKAVIVPLALAVLLAFVLNPIVGLVQRRGLGRVPAVLMTVLFAFLVFGAIGSIVGIEVNSLARELPDKKAQIQKKIAALKGTGEGPIPRLLQMVREIGQEPGKTDAASDGSPSDKKEVVVARQEELSDFERLIHAAGPVLEPLATASLVTILVVFMLIKREDLRNRLIGLLGQGHLTGTTRVLVDSAERLSRYLLNQLLVNVSVGIVFGIGLLVIGVPYAFLWGFLTAILRFIPYIGTWISAAFPILLSFAVSDGWTQPVIVLVFFAVLDLVTANVIEPLLFGHSTGVTPIALLVAAAFWTWVWGPIGLVLSTPLTVCLVVLGQHVPRFRFLALLLGDRPALELHLSYYQRLLARDQDEASQLAQEHATLHTAEKTYDEVLIPALLQAHRDRKNGTLNPEDESFVLQATGSIQQSIASAGQDGGAEVSDPSAGMPSTAHPAPHHLVLACPAHHEAEELTLAMLRHLLQADGYATEVTSTKALPSDVVERIQKEHSSVVFVAVLPPGGLAQARYLCKQLRKRFPDLWIVVGYWGGHGHFDDILVRLRSAGASYVTTSLAQSRGQILSLVQASMLHQSTDEASQPRALVSR